MTNVSDFVTKNSGTIGAGIGGLAIGGAVGFLAGRKSRKKRVSKRRTKNHNTRKRSSSNKRRQSKQKRPYTAGKRKDISKRRIRYTKNNQPYIILASGKARFIKKKSVKNARKRPGGRY